MAEGNSFGGDLPGAMLVAQAMRRASEVMARAVENDNVYLFTQAFSVFHLLCEPLDLAKLSVQVLAGESDENDAVVALVKAHVLRPTRMVAMMELNHADPALTVADIEHVLDAVWRPLFNGSFDWLLSDQHRGQPCCALAAPFIDIVRARRGATSGAAEGGGD